MATVRCTRALVVTNEWFSSDADGADAAVALCADAAVVAIGRIGDVGASLHFVARVVRASVAVIAADLGSARTRAAAARFTDSTHVAVVAGRGVVGVLAARAGVTTVRRADLAVVAIQRLARHAFAQRTGVALGASVAVATHSLVGDVDAALGAVA